VFEQERAVDQLDEDAAVVDGLDAAGDLHQLFSRRLRDLRRGGGAANFMLQLCPPFRGCAWRSSRPWSECNDPGV
jgi:hypothetical protein